MLQHSSGNLFMTAMTAPNSDDLLSGSVRRVLGSEGSEMRVRRMKFIQ